MADLTPPPDKVLERLQQRFGAMLAQAAVEADSWAALYQQADEQLTAAREEVAALKAKYEPDDKGAAKP